MAMPSTRRKGSPSMSMRSANVPLSPSSALQAMNLRSEAMFEDRLPLDACREARPAPASKAGVGHRRHDLLRRHLERPAQSGEAPGRLVVRHRERIVDPDPCERETGLASQLGDLLGLPQAQPVRRAVEHPGVEELTDAPGFDRAVGDAPFGGGDLHERLEPEHPA